MVSMDEVDDRTFRVNFSADGLAKLQGRIRSKLKELLGDCADDSLVEYVLVLITNGRHKKEAKSELDVFLGDDSDSFVSWLWDHLASNLDLYAQSKKPDPDETLKPKATSVELDGTHISCHQHSDKQAELEEALKKRHNRKWRSFTSNECQQPFLRSLVVGEVEHERKAALSVCHTKQSVSPNPPSKRKRGQNNEHENTIEHERPKPIIGSFSRLFQSAVRDAVSTTGLSSSLKGAGVKRLRCVVSTPNGKPHRIQSIARVPNTEEEAVEDAVKVESTRHVFDQLNHDAGASESTEEVASVRYIAVPDEYDYYYHRMEEIQKMDYYHPQVDDHDVSHGVGAAEIAEELALFRQNAVLDEYDDYYRRMEEIQQMGYHHPQMDDLQVDYYHNLEKSLLMHVEQVDYSSKYKGNTPMQWNDTLLASGFVSVDHQGYDAINVINDKVVDVIQTGSSRGRKRDDSLMVQDNMAQKADQVSVAHLKDPPVSAPSASHKILNISVNVNTGKPPHIQPEIDATELDSRRSLQQNEVGVGKSIVPLMKENKNSVTPNGNGKVAIKRLDETQKNTTSGPGLYSTGDSLEDTNARTIVLNNVHFAATKDSLSQHFNRFGEVLKVFILTDAATGQPKGSAYVEFTRKDAAENALSLDGASFMSRILKVAKKSSYKQESTPTLAAARFSRAPFPRVFLGAQPLAKPGAKSLQWKRNTQPSTSQKVTSLTSNKSNPPSVAGRGLTYIRKT